MKPPSASREIKFVPRGQARGRSPATDTDGSRWVCTFLDLYQAAVRAHRALGAAAQCPCVWERWMRDPGARHLSFVVT